MFIKRETFETMRNNRDALYAGYTEQARQIAAQQATIDWLMVRVTQVEKERAQLFERYTGIKLAVPEITRAPETRPHAFDSPVSFQDIGDAAAGAEGLGWNDDGTLKV